MAAARPRVDKSLWNFRVPGHDRHACGTHLKVTSFTAQWINRIANLIGNCPSLKRPAIGKRYNNAGIAAAGLTGTISRGTGFGANSQPPRQQLTEAAKHHRFPHVRMRANLAQDTY